MINGTLGRTVAEQNAEIAGLLRRGLSPEEIAAATFEDVELVRFVAGHPDAATEYYRFFPQAGRWVPRTAPIDSDLPTPKEIEERARRIRSRW